MIWAALTFLLVVGPALVAFRLSCAILGRLCSHLVLALIPNRTR